MSEALQKHTVKSLIDSDAFKGRIKQLLGERAPQFCTSVIQISQDNKMARCEPNSIIAAAMIAGTLDLPINPNLAFAYIVPYGSMAQFQIGYKGYVQLAMRSGQYKRLNVTVVYEGELMKYDRVKSDVVLDETQRKSDKVIGYVAYFELVNGAEHAEYWDKSTVEKHAARFSQAYKAKKMDSPWFQDFDAMAKKTVLKSLLSHWGPLSVQMQTAVLGDQSARASLDAEPEFIDTTSSVQEEDPKIRKPRGKKEELAAAAPEPDKNATMEVVPKTRDEIVAHVIGKLDASKVPMDDLTDYLSGQGLCRNAKDYTDMELLPPSIFEAMYVNDSAILNKIIKLYGKA